MENAKLLKVLAICLVFVAGATVAYGQSMTTSKYGSSAMTYDQQKFFNTSLPTDGQKYDDEKYKNTIVSPPMTEKELQEDLLQKRKNGTLTPAEKATMEFMKGKAGAEKRLAVLEDLKAQADAAGVNSSKYDSEISSLKSQYGL